MHLDRITQPWDWRTWGTGRDKDRLWWADKPAALLWRSKPLEAPSQGPWYAVDVTDLYNAWQSERLFNFGLQLRPALPDANEHFNEFYSSDYMDNPSLRPKLVIIPATMTTASAGFHPKMQIDKSP